MEPFKDFPEVDQAMKALTRLHGTLFKPAQDASGKFIQNDISIDTLVRTRQLLGNIVNRAESAGGVKLGSAKEAFKAISDDLDKIASSPSLTGEAAKVAKSATQRAKLEFAVKNMESAVAQFTKQEGDDLVINVKSLNKWLRDITNPKSKKFDKNFTDALKDEIPDIKKRLDELTKIIGSKNPGGPGSLVVRGRLTSAAVGAMAGVGAGGPLGGAVGALIGTNVPEMLTAAMSTKMGAQFLNKAVNAGKGSINMRTWVTLGEIVTRSAGESQEAPVKAELKAL